MDRPARVILAVTSAAVTGFVVASFGPPAPVTQLTVAAGVAVAAAPVVYAATGRAEGQRARKDAA